MIIGHCAVLTKSVQHSHMSRSTLVTSQAGFGQVHYSKVREQLQDKHNKVMQNSQFPQLEIKHEIFDLVLILSSLYFLSLFFCSCITQKLHSVCKQSADQTNALLLDIFLFLHQSCMRPKISELWLQTFVKMYFPYAIFAQLIVA